MSNLYIDTFSIDASIKADAGEIAFWGETDAVQPLATPTSLAASTNPLSSAQWYLARSTDSSDSHGSGADATWSEVTGRGVTIGLIDSGFDIRHRDLAGRFDLTASYDPRDRVGAISITPDRPASEAHGTWTAGVLGADGANNWGTIGVAHEADLVGDYIRLGSGGSSRAEIAGLLARQVSVDVSNNSWGYTTQFQDNFRDYGWSDVAGAITSAATSGREGLGTVLVFAAGNDRRYVSGDARLDGDNTNNHSLTNSRYVTTVAASDAQGRVASFSTPGASVLVAAPGTSIFTTGVDDGDGNRDNDFVYVSGTSFSAPIVSGVVALVLEANPELGYRDIRDILAYSAKRTVDADVQWDRNGAGDWNGGGLQFNHDLGFGVVDAHAAVRLAQTWTAPARTAANEVELVAGSASGLTAAIDESHGQRFLIEVSDNSAMRTQSVELDLTIVHPHVGDLVVRIISPSGTESIVLDRPGAGSNARENLRVTLSSVHFAGEPVAGEWQVIVDDNGQGGTGYVEAYQLRLFGDATVANRAFVFTDDLARLGPVRLDALAGQHVFNAAAVTSDTVLSLNAGTATVAGEAVTITAGTVIARSYLGDGSDTVIGSARADVINAGSGDDHVIAGAGDDTVDGQDGDDVLAGDAGNDRLHGGAGNDTLLGNAGNDRLEAGSGDDVLAGGAGANTLVGGAGDDSYVVESGSDTLVELVDEGRDIVYSYVNHTLGAEFEVLALFGGARHGKGNGLDNLIVGSAGDDWLTGEDGDDVIYGGAGNDTLLGGNGDDYLIGMSGADRLIGGAGDDSYIVQGAGTRVTENANGGHDTVYALIDYTLDANLETLSLVGRNINGAGNDGDNVIIGTAGNNRLDGGRGADTLYGGAGDDQITGGLGRDTLIGHSGRDSFVYQTPGQGDDMLLDFISGEDHIKISATNFGFLASSALIDGENFISAGSPFAIHARPTFLFDRDSQQLYFDADGTGDAGASLLFTILNPQQLSASDILLV